MRARAKLSGKALVVLHLPASLLFFDLSFLDYFHNIHLTLVHVARQAVRYSNNHHHILLFDHCIRRNHQLNTTTTIHTTAIMFAKAIVVGALAALAAAQSASLGFTKVPTPVKAGQAETISYRASDESSVYSNRCDGQDDQTDAAHSQ